MQEYYLQRDSSAYLISRGFKVIPWFCTGFETLLHFLLAVVACRGETQCVGNVHNVSSTRVAEFNLLSENVDSRCLTCAYSL